MTERLCKFSRMFPAIWLVRSDGNSRRVSIMGFDDGRDIEIIVALHKFRQWCQDNPLKTNSPAIADRA